MMMSGTSLSAGSFFSLLQTEKPFMRGSSIDEQDEIGPIGRGGLQPDVAVVDDLRDEPEAAELGPELAGERGVTLEDENFGGHGGWAPER